MKGQQAIPPRRPRQQPQRQPQQPKKAMPKQAEPKEKVLAKIYASRLTFYKFYVIGVLFFALWVILWFNLLPAGSISDFLMSQIGPYKLYLFALLGAGIISILLGERKIKYEKYYLTTDKIRHTRGLINPSENILEYEMISHYSTKSNLIENLFGHGTIILDTVSGTGSGRIVFKHIPHVKKVKKIIEERVGATRGRYGR